MFLYECKMAFSQPNCGCNPVNGYTGCDYPCPCTGDDYFKALQCACNTTHGANCAAVTTYCGACCGQSATPDWTILFGSYACVGCDKYYLEVDLNSCSPSYQGTRTSDALAEANSSYCCAVQCVGYNILDYGYVNYTDCTGNQYNQYMNPWDSICAQYVHSGAVSTGGPSCISEE